jgi:hypothetical protein
LAWQAESIGSLAYCQYRSFIGMAFSGIPSQYLHALLGIRRLIKIAHPDCPSTAKNAPLQKSSLRFLCSRRAFSNNALPERRTKKPRHSCRGLVGRRLKVAFSDEGNPRRVLANVCGRLKVNRFHPNADFFNGLHCVRPEQIYFLTLLQIPLVSATTFFFNCL